MGDEVKQDCLCSIKKSLRSVRTSWRCASEHRALFSLVLLLYLLYKSSPGFFAFLLSSSPVIICTTLLLGVLLSYGSSHLAEIDEDRTDPADISAPNFGSSSGHVHLKAYQRYSVPAVKENIIREASFGRRDSNKRMDLDESVPLLKGVDQRDGRIDAADGRLGVGMEESMKVRAEKESKDAFLSKGEEHANLFEDVHQSRVDGEETTFGLHSQNEDVEMLAKSNHQGRVFTDSQSGEVADASEHKCIDVAAGKCRWGRAFSVRQRKRLADIKIEAINPVVDDQFDCSLCSSFTGVGNHDCSTGLDPDNAEQYSPDVPMTNTAPVLDVTETEPLLGADFSRPDPTTNDDPDNHSNISSQDTQLDSNSNDVASSMTGKGDGEKKKDAGNEPAFLWTADDEKNVMDLGYSEMERNRRLEILIAKRKSRKHMDVGCIADDLSSFRPRVLPIPARRMNPFADESEMPGSAPSILHPHKNPFDFLTEHSNDSGVPAHHNPDSKGFIPVSNQDMSFKRQESFNYGGPQRHVPRFKPCFVLDEFNSEEASTSNFQRQFSDRSRLSVVSECDTVSSVGNQEHNELIRNYIRRVRESSSLIRQDSDLVYAGSECSDGISFVDNETSNTIIC